MRRQRQLRITRFEQLETKTLLSGIPVSGFYAVNPSADPADVITVSTDLGSLESGQSIQIAETIDRDGFDVDWYQFTIDEASSVEFLLSSGVVGVYDSSFRDVNDQQHLDGHRLLSQAMSSETEIANLKRNLAAGTYYVAVSGSGNRFFHSGIMNSGIAGQTGDYLLNLTATALALDPSSPPIVLATDLSPLVARLNLSAALPFVPKVKLTDVAGADVPTKWTNFNSTTFEIQIAPARSWSAGTYQVVLLGPDGSVQMTFPLEISTSNLGEQGLLGNDTPATAIELGNLGSSGLLQISGIVGDDPYFDLNSSSSVFAGNDADLYYFTITQSGNFGLQADVFAGRIGSRLDVGLSLYRRDAATGHLVFVAGNNNTHNTTRSTDNSIPFFNDATITTGLTVGDYYLAVTSGLNAISPLEFQNTTDGIIRFNPEQSHSGTAGSRTGPYVLNLELITISAPPEVVTVSLVDGSSLTSAPTQLTVQFSQYLNLTSVATNSFHASNQSTIAGVYIQNTTGNKFYPRLVEFDSSNTAHFLMLDRLPVGNYTLHLDGHRGLANIVGNPLVGNNTEGDFQVDFTLTTPVAGGAGNSYSWSHRNQDDSLASPQMIGPVFPHELQTGITIRRSASLFNGTNDTDDFYRIEILQNQSYAFQFTNFSLLSGATFQLLDLQGRVLAESALNNDLPVVSHLAAGSYIIHIGNWPKLSSQLVNYQVRVNLIGNADNAPPLYSGPAPAVGIRLATAVQQEKSVTIPPVLEIGGIRPDFGREPNSSIPVSATAPQFSPASTFRGTADSTNALGSLRSLLPVGTSTFVIAVPTLSKSLNTGVGQIRQATRTGIRGAGLNERPAPIGLSELADGLIGNASSDDDKICSKLQKISSLQSLLESEFSHATQNELVKDHHNHEVTEPGIEESTPLNSETHTLEEKVSRNRSHPNSSFSEESSPPTHIESTPQVNPAVSQVRFADPQGNQFFNGLNQSGEMVEQVRSGEITSATPNSNSAISIDTVFAAGLSLIVIGTCIQHGGHTARMSSPSSRLTGRQIRGRISTV